MPRDCNGREVNVGDRVRIVALGDKFINGLPVDERARLKSMIGEIFEVYEIDSYAQPWVEKFWNCGDDRVLSHSIALAPEEMEWVSGKDTT
ncbi:MAG TPA: hypothetical protein VGK57_09970 [Candidatus Binatia bacterium]